MDPYEFLAPEQHKDPSVRSQQVDVYSFGLTLLYCMKGKLPWSLDAKQTEIKLHKQNGIIPSTGQPLADHVLHKCLHPNPQKRGIHQFLKLPRRFWQKLNPLNCQRKLLQKREQLTFIFQCLMQQILFKKYPTETANTEPTQTTSFFDDSEQIQEDKSVNINLQTPQVKLPPQQRQCLDFLISTRTRLMRMKSSRRFKPLQESNWASLSPPLSTQSPSRKPSLISLKRVIPPKDRPPLSPLV